MPIFGRRKHLQEIPNFREVIETTIRMRERYGFLARPGLADEAMDAVCRFTSSEYGENDWIDILEPIIYGGTYWHWTDEYAGSYD